jgi:hypothetical protein
LNSIQLNETTLRTTSRAVAFQQLPGRFLTIYEDRGLKTAIDLLLGLVEVGWQVNAI